MRNRLHAVPKYLAGRFEYRPPGYEGGLLGPRHKRMSAGRVKSKFSAAIILLGGVANEAGAGSYIIEMRKLKPEQRSGGILPVFT